MSGFWFLVAVALLVVWLVDRSSLKKQNTERYNRGWWDGYGYLKDKIHTLSKIDADSIRKLDKEVLRSAGVEATAEVVAESSGADDPGALFQESAAVETGVQDIYTEPGEYTEQQPALSTEDIAAAKERRTLQNLNTLLYVGSFLIVAAAAVFVTLATPPAVKLASLVLVTAAFYTAGLVLHAKSTRLKPAALAFVGTGLAILPFVGFALTLLGGFSAQSAWLLVSLVGLFAYAMAAVRLQSQLVSYLTMAFVLSLALSAVATLSLSIVWYFIVTIGVSVVCNSIHYLWPKLLPQVFWQPVEQTGVITTPVALVASLFTIGAMDLFMYIVLFGVATAHYLVVWLEHRMRVYEIVARGLAHMTAFMVVCDKVDVMTSEGRTVLLLAWIVLAVGQILYSLGRVRKAVQQSTVIEASIIGIMLGLIVLAMPGWALVNHTAEWLALIVAIAGVLALLTALRLRQVAWLYGTLAATVALPFIVLRWIVTPALSYELIALVFAVLSALALVVLERTRAANRSLAVRLFVACAMFVYVGFLVLCGALASTSAAIGWTAIVAAGLLVLASYVLRLAAVEVVGAVLVVVATAAGVDVINIPTEWQLVVTVVVAAAVVAGAALVHHAYSERGRRNSLAVVAVTVLAGLVLTFYTGNTQVVATSTALLLASGIVALALRIAVPNRAGLLSGLALCAYIAYPVLAIPLAVQAGAGWPVLGVLVLAAVLWVSSYIEKVPAMLAVGHGVFYVALHLLWSWLQFDETWRWFGTLWLAAAVWYLLYWYSYSRQDAARQLVSFVAVQVALVAGAAAYLFGHDQRMVFGAAGSLLAAAGVLAVHGAIAKSLIYIEVAVYAATFSLQRMASLLLPELNIVAYGHWWAATIALVAVWRKQLHARLIVALALITGSSGVYALIGAEGYSLLFLVEHLIVLVAGAVLRKQWAMWWGIIAVVVAVLYFLRNFTALALLFLGFLLILFVIWRLLKVGKK